jgi:hypothetical protein
MFFGLAILTRLDAQDARSMIANFVDVAMAASVGRPKPFEPADTTGKHT